MGDHLTDSSWQEFKTRLDVEGVPAPFQDINGLAKIALFRSLRPHDVMPEIRVSSNQIIKVVIVLFMFKLPLESRYELIINLFHLTAARFRDS